ncbi:MAG: hypothetical protein ACXW1A_04060 [Nitrososphaeraceae archaeon]
MVKVLIRIIISYFMEGIQKLKCSSCGSTFMSETGMAKCPSCLEKESQGAGNTAGCGCGHQH